jgi:hypothetical protein
MTQIAETTNPNYNNNHSRNFRPLNTLEMKTVVHMVQTKRIPEDHPLINFLDEAQVSYENMQGGFCVCIILLDSKALGSFLWRGASRRSYKDPRKPIRGESLAFSRALLYSRAVEI